MKKFFLIFFLFSGCVYNHTEDTNNYSNINFSEDLSLEEFKIKLEEYSKNSPYPNIDN
tara:strand:+ start:1441 stop:1614 length:174 start_codon:yes stop_codon:yes gene_type:complete